MGYYSIVVCLELLYEAGFEGFRTLKLKNSRVGRGLVCQAIWF